MQNLVSAEHADVINMLASGQLRTGIMVEHHYEYLFDLISPWLKERYGIVLESCYGDYSDVIVGRGSNFSHLTLCKDLGLTGVRSTLVRLLSSENDILDADALIDPIIETYLRGETGVL